MRPIPRPALLASGLLGAVLVLSGCSSAPKPPRANESSRRPANDPVRIELLKALTELERARVELELQRRLAQAQRVAGEIQAGAAPVRLAARHDEVAGGSGTSNAVYVVRFASGSTRPSLSPEALDTLGRAARQAALVVLRGRTDGRRETRAESRIARRRAENMRALLLNAGVTARRIRLSYQAVGDPVASNDTAQGRSLNRRVEIELYARAPTVIPLSANAGSPSPALP